MPGSTTTRGPDGAPRPGLLILWILIKRGNFEDIEKKERTEAAES